MERVRERPFDTESRIRLHYRTQLLKLLLSVVCVVVGLAGGVAGIAYASDTHKIVPVAVKYLLSSVVNGVPSDNATEVWEANFKSPSVRVWPYYSLFGVLTVAVLVLCVFAWMGCSFGEKDRVRPCCDCTDCCDRTCCCQCQTSDCDCDCCHCNSNDCRCDGDILPILFLIVAVAIILSAFFVLVCYVIRKAALLYDRYTHMLRSQAEELEGDTIVLGVAETWRPLNSV